MPKIFHFMRWRDCEEIYKTKRDRTIFTINSKLKLKLILENANSNSNSFFFWRANSNSNFFFLEGKFMIPGRGGQIQIKSNRHKNDFISNQIKSRTFLQGVKSNQIMILGKNNCVKSNHDLIRISNQNFGRNQNQAIIRSKMRFHRQIWHRSKALSELFPSVPLVSPESTFWIKKWIDNDFANSNQIKSWEKGRQIKSNHVI